MLAKKVNKLRNSAFRFGKDAPAHWEWEASGRGARWKRTPTTPGITLTCSPATKKAELHQSVRCKPAQFYRIEATVQCSLEPTTATDRTGFALAVQSEEAEEDPRRSAAILQAPEPVNNRAYYQTGPTTRQLRITLGVYNATGEATVLSVRLIPILEPDEISHPMAMPPPPRTCPPPRTARKVCIGSETAGSRKVTKLLRRFFGPANVETKEPSRIAAKESADAILLPDDAPPRALSSLARLKALAETHIVVISTSAFAKLAGSALSLKRIEQVDDPIHAEVTYANHATAGFALHDAFAYAWQGKEPATFRQNHFRKTDDFARFCKRHGFVHFLASMCDRDAASHQPMALYRASGRGGLYVLDIDPVETEPSTMNEPALAVHLLLNILGHNRTQLGQFVSPVRKEAHFRDAIREFAGRIEHIKVHDADAPSSEVTEQLVTIGGEDQSYGLPLRPKPLILIRSGLRSGDYESVYGAWGWLKQFVRPAPHACPYAQALASRFRIAWVPCAAPWETGDGWQGRGLPPRSPMAIETEDCEVAAMIDVVCRSVNRVRVIAASEDRLHERRARWLPRLFASFAPTDVFTFGPAPGCSFDDRRTFGWGHAFPLVRESLLAPATARQSPPARVQDPLPVREPFLTPIPSSPRRFPDPPARGSLLAPPFGYTVDPSSFDDPAHHDVQAAGGAVLRIEAPGHSADFVAQSIARTDMIAAMLEHVLGTLYGLVAVNRRTAAIDFDGFPPVAPGEALIVPHDDPALRLESSQAI